MSFHSLFYTTDGRFRRNCLAACGYLFITVLTLKSSGWRTVEWVGWFLMALGFFFDTKTEEKPKRSLRWLTVNGVMLAGAALVTLHTFRHWF